LINSGLGRAAKSRVRTRIWINEDLNSRLMSARSAARWLALCACSTSYSPTVKAMPLIRKPATGITASAMMRTRTETPDMMR
jgi:hypothetical protein